MARSRQIGPLVAALTLSASASLPATANAEPPSGDPEAIALNRQVQQAYSVLPGVKVVQHGLLFARREGRHDHRYVAGKKKGYKAATETVYFVLSSGKVSAYLDEVRAQGVGRFSVLVNSTGVFRSQARPAGCWHRASPSETTFGKTGTAFVDLNGDHFSPLEYRGSHVISRLTYRTGPVKAAVVEVIDLTTHQFVSARWTYKIRRRSLRFTSTYSALGSAPSLPKPVPIC
jgi:hypothetical protein